MATLPDVQGQSQQPVPQAGSGVATYEPPNWRQVGMAGETIARSGRDLEEASNLVAATNERQYTFNAQAAGNQLAKVRTDLEYNTDTGFRNAKEGQADYHQPKPTPRLPVPTQRDRVNSVFDVS